jgi:hypothetical protein
VLLTGSPVESRDAIKLRREDGRSLAMNADYCTIEFQSSTIVHYVIRKNATPSNCLDQQLLAPEAADRI